MIEVPGRTEFGSVESRNVGSSAKIVLLAVLHVLGRGVEASVKDPCKP